jgi:hypothetical protein
VSRRHPYITHILGYELPVPRTRREAGRAVASAVLALVAAAAIAGIAYLPSGALAASVLAVVLVLASVAWTVLSFIHRHLPPGEIRRRRQVVARRGRWEERWDYGGHSGPARRLVWVGEDPPPVRGITHIYEPPTRPNPPGAGRDDPAAWHNLGNVGPPDRAERLKYLPPVDE